MKSKFLKRELHQIVAYICLILVPVTILGCTYFIFSFSLDDWKNNPTKHFREIKDTLNNTGNISKIERNLLSQQIVTHSMAIKASNLAMPEFDVVWKVIVGTVVLLAAYALSHRFTAEKPTLQPTLPYQEDVSKIKKTPTRLSLHTDLDKSIVTVDGLVISILAGFLISAKIKNLIIIDAFLIIIVSLILALTAHTSIVKAIRSEKSEKEIQMDKKFFENFSRTSALAFWFLILGLILVTFSFL